MLRKFYAQRKVPLSFSKALLSSYKNSFSNLASASAPSRLSDVISKHGSCCRFSVMASDAPTTVPDGDGNIVPAPLRSYQVVVAATRDMGIGKDGKLPWRLPSDLKFFKELTTATSDPGKKNAVVMGRKTWESIPLLYKPLPGRLNVVLTRSGSFDLATAENVIICGSVTSALELLAEPPYSVSIEKVFIIGGGEIYRETLNGIGCDAIHITEIEASIKCDTFIPAIDTSAFKLWYVSPPMVENNIRYLFATYVRVRNSAIGSDPSFDEVKLSRSLHSTKFEVEKFIFLPKLIFEKHNEHMHLRLLQDNLSNGD